MNEPLRINNAFSYANKNLRGAIIAECIKCGVRCEDDLISASTSTTTGSNGFFQQTVTFKGNISTKHVVDSFGEFLSRNCLVCGYSWEDATVDSFSETNT